MLNKEAKMTRIIDGGAVLVGDRKTKYVGLRLSTMKEIFSTYYPFVIEILHDKEN